MTLTVKVILLAAFATVFIVYASPTPQESSAVSSRQGRSAFVNFINRYFGRACRGCPAHFCETDPGIVLGYCCGCRGTFDILPIVCSPAIICPLDIRGVCHDYEYMLRCCC